MKKEIEEAFQTLVTLPLRKPKSFSLEEVWNEPMVTLTKDLLDLINRDGFFTENGYEDDEALAALIGTKCFAQSDYSNNHGIDEKKLREIFSKGSKKERDKVYIRFYDEQNCDAAHDIGWYLRDEEEYETVPNDVKRDVAINLRVYLENGGDLAKLVKEVTAIYNNEME